jgi:hypothetical protein
MSGREQDPDDWFAEPAGPPRRRDEPDADDWIGGDEPLRPPRRGGWQSLPPAQRLGLVGIAGLLLLLVVLAAAGVFSSNSAAPAPTTTTQPAATTTAPTTTTAPPPALPTVTLKPGDTGPQVKRLQRALTRLGYSTGKIDGSYGPGTKAAVAAFQKAAGLTADGVVGPATLAALRSRLAQAG